MYSSYIKVSVFLLVIGMAAIALAAPANAQISNNPWGFQPQNRASVAALIRQVEKGQDSNAALTQFAAPSATNLVCGSDGKASASGNTTCVILNNSDGSINIGQDADGDQTATSSTDEILATLANQDD